LSALAQRRLPVSRAPNPSQYPPDWTVFDEPTLPGLPGQAILPWSSRCTQRDVTGRAVREFELMRPLRGEGRSTQVMYPFLIRAMEDSRHLRACLKIATGPAARGFGPGQGG